MERSLEHFESSLLSIARMKKSEILVNDADVTSLLNGFQQLKDREFDVPQWDLEGCNYNSFIKLSIYIENEQIRFRESEDMVKNEFIDIYRNIIVSFEKFLNPKFAKIISAKQEETLSENLLRDIQLNFDSDMGGMTKEDFQKFFKSFWPQI